MTATGANDEPVIVDAQIAAGHDGSAELVLTLSFPGAGLTKVTLGTEAGLQLMRTCAVHDIEGLRGHSWRAILGAAG